MAMNNSALEKFTELMISKLKEVNSNDWQKPWFSPTFIGYPQNLSGRTYHNINKFLLYAICDENKYRTPVFMTFNQIKKEGLSVKGQHSFPIIYYDIFIKNKTTGKSIDKDFYNNLSNDEKVNYKVIPILKYYNVFNLDQTDFAEKYPERWESIQNKFKTPAVINTNNKYHNTLIDKVIENQSWVCPINLKNQSRAFYRPSDDFITLPTFEQFSDGKAFYYTALHEMAHSTGHSSRLNRKLSSSFYIKEYAHEELIAELSSAVTGKDMGLSVVPREENAQYIKSWMKQISDDPKYLFSILNDVNKAVTMIEETISLDKYIENITISPNIKEIQNNETPNQLLIQCRPIINKYENLGYTSLSETIKKYFPSYEKAKQTGGIANYKIKEVEIQSSGSRSLFGSIIINQEGISIDNESLYIKDRSIGTSDKIYLTGINILEIPAGDIHKLLSGGKVKTSKAGNETYKLNKNLFGWELKREIIPFHSSEAQASM